MLSHNRRVGDYRKELYLSVIGDIDQPPSVIHELHNMDAQKRPDTPHPDGEVLLDLYSGSRRERVSRMQDGAASVIQEDEVVTGEVSILKDVVPRTLPA